MVTIVNKHHIRKIDSKIMIILCFASFTIDGTVILRQHNLIQLSATCPCGLRYRTSPYYKNFNLKNCNIGTLFTILKHIGDNINILITMALYHIVALWIIRQS